MQLSLSVLCLLCLLLACSFHLSLSLSLSLSFHSCNRDPSPPVQHLPPQPQAQAEQEEVAATHWCVLCREDGSMEVSTTVYCVYSVKYMYVCMYMYIHGGSSSVYLPALSQPSVCTGLLTEQEDLRNMYMYMYLLIALH